MGRVMISIPDEFLAEIDAVAAEEHRSRSELFREAMRAYLAMRGPARRVLREKPNVQWALEIMEQARRKGQPGIASTAEIRKWRDRR